MADKKIKNDTPYLGFERGPIRPPSEAHSLLIRVTRNCPWNRCTFCPVYKGARFSLRDPEHVKKDIDTVYRSVEMVRDAADSLGNVSREQITAIADQIPPEKMPAFNAALHWMNTGMQSVFLQDANSLIIKPDDLIDILQHLRKRFPDIKRVTSYARSHTICRIKPDKLAEIRQSGLNRIHIGLESGSDKVLAMVKKGVTKAEHITAGQRAKQAGFELSEYVMPGLGGRALSAEHAAETADALNQINADFIRLRTLAIPPGLPLHDEYTAGRFTKCTDIEMAKELFDFIEQLDGITSQVVSDHMLNLFEEVTGTLPDDKESMLAPIRQFLTLPPQDQMYYQVGRRLSLFSRLADMNDQERMTKVKDICDRAGITPDNAEQIIEETMNRFI